ncbi:MAG TPA: tetratricopeptide repeat protein, partial [Blastocatellia bacterium]|nr:tetratricopeptide repeat protein [Blastocatellia bacterium]
MYRTNINFIQRVKANVGLALALVLISSSVVTGQSRGQGRQIEKLNRFVQTSDTSSASSQRFRKGRDLIADEEWAEAVTAFDSFIREYPKDANIDAALYWLAFALKKQDRLSESKEKLERVLKEFPRSRWSDDARALRLEIAALTGERDVINNALGGQGTGTGTGVGTGQGGSGSSSDEEMKIVALQSLMMA